MPTSKQPQTEPQEPTNRYEAQVALIRRAFQAEKIEIGVAAAEEPPGEIDFLYEQGTILVRDEDIARVRTVVGERAEVRDSLINGLTLLSLAGTGLDTPAALAAIDRALGVGAATPNHVVSISPISHCPATEPEEVLAGAGPDPGVCPAGGDGGGVRVQAVDNGLLDGAAGAHAWLAGVQGARDPFPQPPPQGATIPPYTGHGTFIAGVARCMAPAAEVFVEAFFEHAGATLESTLIRRLYRALNRHPDVISLSAGLHTRSGLPSLGFEVFLQRLRHHKGVVLVAAAGNDGIPRPFWPAAAPGVVGVGALSANWRSRASFSNYGGWVDVYAPGEGLVNAYATGVYECFEPPHRHERRRFQGMARWSGTSFATPLVAGLIAARMSRTGEDGRTAAAALLATARSQAVHGLGAVLLPCLEATGHGGHEDCRCGHGHHRCPRC